MILVNALLEALGGLAATSGGSFWLPQAGSKFAHQVDAAWDLVYWISMFFFVLVTVLMVAFVVLYRRRKSYRQQASASHNTPLEIFWTVVPVGLVVVLFWQGYKSFLDLATPPSGAYEVTVTGQKWNWLFTYPNGYVDGTLHVPVDRPVKLVMSSQDVIHSFYVPAFRVKRDVMPGRYTYAWFEAVEPGTYEVFCTEYCGTGHSTMGSTVVVHPTEATEDMPTFDQWLEEASDFLARMAPAEAGQMLYQVRGCKQCHSVDGVAGIGPSFLGLYGTMEMLTTGDQVPVDENYIRESILYPQAKVTAGYDPVMPTYQGRLKDEEIGAIIEYLKTLAP